MRLPSRSNYNNKVSVIVAAYNVEKFIDKCVTSILEQSYTNYELICIDDCSTDGTKKILEKLQNDNCGIKIIYNEINLGVSEVRNLGIAIATGKWICFVDGDDYLENNMIELLVNKAEEEDVDLVIGNYFSDNNGKLLPEYYYENISSNMSRDQMQIDAILGIRNLSTSVGVPWGRLYKRSMLIENNILFIPGLKRMQDMIFNLYVFQLANKIALIDDYIYYYRLHKKSSTHAYDDSFLATAERIVIELNKFVKKYSKDWKDVIIIEELHLMTEAVKISCLSDECPMTYREKIAFIDSAKKIICDFRSERRKFVGKNHKDKVVYFLLKNEMYKSFLFLCSLRKLIININN